MPMDGGSSFARNQYAPIVGCARPWIPKMNFCMRKIFARVASCGVTCFPVDHALLNAAHVARQLGVAATPHSPSSSRPRYTFVPAAVGARNFTTDFGNVIPGAYANPHARSAKVEVVNFPSWFARHFRAEDYVLVKLDIEGFEHTVLRQLLAQSSGPLIDHLAWECHPVGSAKCTNLSRALTAHGVPWMADRTYEGLLSSKDEWHARVAGLRADLLSPACARFNVTVYEPSGKLGQKCHVAGEPRCHEATRSLGGVNSFELRVNKTHSSFRNGFDTRSEPQRAAPFAAKPICPTCCALAGPVCARTRWRRSHTMAKESPFMPRLVPEARRPARHGQDADRLPLLACWTRLRSTTRICLSST